MSLAEEIKINEGFVSTPYRDTEGILTIGYGYNLEEPMPEPLAEIMLSYKLAECSDFANKKLHFFENLSINRQEVLIEMLYNLGPTRFMKFKKMIDEAERGNVDGVCREMKDSKWYRQVKNRAIKLINKYRIG